MTTTDRILLTLLARLDVTHWANRRADYSGAGSAVVHELRTAYKAGGGFAWRIGGSATQRSREERTLREVESSGLIAIGGPQGKHRKLRLTERGEHVARALADLPTLVDAHRVLGDVVGLTVTHRDYGPLCPETWLIGLDDYREGCQGDLMYLTTELSPAVIRGFARWQSDLHGRAYITITAEGIVWAAGEPPALPDDLPGPIDEGFEVYVAEANRFRGELRDSPAPAGEIGEIPLPCSISLKRPKDA